MLENMEPSTLVRADSGVVSPRAVLRAMGIHASRVWQIAGRCGTHWVVVTPDGRVVLRRYAPDRSYRDVTYEVQLLERLDGRGQYDDVARGYEEVSPLEPVERELIVPIY